MTGYAEFRSRIDALKTEICLEIYRSHQDRIKVKKEAVAVTRLAGIFDHALEISNRFGFQAMSVRDLSEATGISMGALYSYIESKDLLLQMILKLGRLAVHRVLTLPEDLQGAHERLRWLLRTQLYLHDAMQPWFYFSYMESKHFGREERERSIEGELTTERILKSCLEQGREEGVFEVEDTSLCAALIKPILQDWYLKPWKYRRRHIDVETYADHVIDFVEAALRIDRIPTDTRRS